MVEDVNEKSSTAYALVKLVYGTFHGSKLIGEWHIYSVRWITHILHCKRLVLSVPSMYVLSHSCRTSRTHITITMNIIYYSDVNQFVSLIQTQFSSFSHSLSLWTYIEWISPKPSSHIIISITIKTLNQPEWRKKREKFNENCIKYTKYSCVCNAV